MPIKTKNAVLSYFRPIRQRTYRRLNWVVSSRQARRDSVVGTYLNCRAALNREAHYLAGTLSGFQLGVTKRDSAIYDDGIEVLRKAYHALELNPEPSLANVRELGRVRAAIIRFLARFEKALGRQHTHARLLHS